MAHRINHHIRAGLTITALASATVLDGSTSTVNLPPLRVLTVSFMTSSDFGALAAKTSKGPVVSAAQKKCWWHGDSDGGRGPSIAGTALAGPAFEHEIKKVRTQARRWHQRSKTDHHPRRGAASRPESRERGVHGAASALVSRLSSLGIIMALPTLRRLLMRHHLQHHRRVRFLAPASLIRWGVVGPRADGD